MKLSSSRATTFAAIAGLALSACHSLDAPSFPASGSDARIYNTQTGRYEWPDDHARQSPAPQGRLEDRRRQAPALQTGGERTYNPQTGRWENARD